MPFAAVGQGALDSAPGINHAELRARGFTEGTLQKLEESLAAAFDIRFAFFGRTDMEIRLRVLEGRRTRLQERLDRVQSQLAMTQKEVDRYAAELQRHGVESVEREVRWLSDLISAERNQGEMPVTPPPAGMSDAGPTTPDSAEVAPQK